MHQKFLRGLCATCVLGGSLLISACASLTDLPDASPLPNTVALGPAVERFSLSGRAMIRQGQRVDHLRFSWQRSPSGDALLLTTPFGQGIARITRDASGARLQLADGRTLERPNLSELASAVFDAELPLDELPEWLRGAHREWQGLSQGWAVMIEHADATVGPEAQSIYLPRTLAASRGDVSLRLVIDTRDPVQP